MPEPLGAPFFTALDTTGVALSGAVLEFYTAGTSTPATVYSNSTLTTSLGSSVTADSAGRFGDIWLTPSANYKAVLKTSAGATIRTIDPVATATSGVFLTASNNLSDLSNVSTARTNLGLTIGTGGAVVPLLNGSNTWSGLQNFTAGIQASGVDVVTISGTQTLTNKTLSGATIADATNIVLSGTTGSKIGTATTQKFAFWNAAPVVQPTAVADATNSTDVITQLNALLARLRTIGLIAT